MSGPGRLPASGATGPVTDGVLLDRVRQRLAAEGGDPDAVRVAGALRREVGAWCGDSNLLPVLRLLQSEFDGAGPLEPLLRDDRVTDVLVNAPDEVWVDRGDGLRRAEVAFVDEAALRRLATRLVGGAGRRLDDAQPWADARLPGGVRLHAVLPPISPRGTCVSLRVLRPTAYSLRELAQRGAMPLVAERLLRDIVAARLAFLVTGGTGTGKTTLLAALLGLVDPGERIVLVEDAGELRPQHPHVVRLEARPPNVEGAGEVSLRDLVRQALRMRPDRLVVGEVRGAEVGDLLAALNTGHDGGCGTVHANGPGELPARLEALGAMAGMDRYAVHSQVAAGVSVVVHLTRDRDGCRRLSEVRVLAAGPDGLVAAVPAVRVADGEVRTGPGAAQLADLLAERGVPSVTAAQWVSAPVTAAPEMSVPE
jgi:pilus assembly protein CpaF